MQPANTVTVVRSYFNQPAAVNQAITKQSLEERVMEATLSNFSQQGEMLFHLNKSRLHNTQFYFTVTKPSFTQTCYVNYDFINKFSAKAALITPNVIFKKISVIVDGKTGTELGIAPEGANYPFDKEHPIMISVRAFQYRIGPHFSS